MLHTNVLFLLGRHDLMSKRMLTRLWCQCGLLVAWLTLSPGVAGSHPAAAEVFPGCTHIQKS